MQPSQNRLRLVHSNLPVLDDLKPVNTGKPPGHWFNNWDNKRSSLSLHFLGCRVNIYTALRKCPFGDVPSQLSLCECYFISSISEHWYSSKLFLGRLSDDFSDFIPPSHHVVVSFEFGRQTVFKEQLQMFQNLHCLEQNYYFTSLIFAQRVGDIIQYFTAHNVICAPHPVTIRKPGPYFMCPEIALVIPRAFHMQGNHNII